MSALISVRGHTLDQFPLNGPPGEYHDYNDPWDYFAFVMANSAAYINNDGYGVAAYREAQSELGPRQMWHKRVLTPADFGTVFYTGNYLNQGAQDVGGEYDVLDEALHSVRSGEQPSTVVLCHARSASGSTFGNHPFWFNYAGRTFTFMHNGNVNSARAFMINQINLMYPQGDWFGEHPSNHFGSTNPLQWVDTEVLFHYIMCHIVTSGGNFLSALHTALANLRYYVEHPQTATMNFIMSDGDKLIAFRNTPANSYYRLSYKCFRGQFYGLRTQSPAVGDSELAPRELVVFTRDRKPAHYPEFASTNLTFAGVPAETVITRQRPDGLAPALTASPNPFTDCVTLSLKDLSSQPLAAAAFNLRGELIWTQKQALGESNQASVIWNGCNQLGQRQPPGVYLLRITAGSSLYHIRVAMVK